MISVYFKKLNKLDAMQINNYYNIGRKGDNVLTTENLIKFSFACNFAHYNV